MFLTVHSTVGAVIGESTKNPLLAFLAGFLSHFILDMIPHGDENLIENNDPNKTKKLFLLTSLDGGILVGLFGYFFIQNKFQYPLAAIAGAFGAILPDILASINILSKEKLLNRFQALHYANHVLLRKTTIGFPAGLGIQIILFIITISQL